MFGAEYVLIGSFGKDQPVVTVIKHIALTKVSPHIQGPSKEKAVKSLNLTVKKVKEGSKNISVAGSNKTTLAGSNKKTLAGSKMFPSLVPRRRLSLVSIRRLSLVLRR